VRLLFILVACAVIVWLGLTMAARVAVNEAIAKPWPDQLGPVRDVRSRYPEHGTTQEAQMVVQVAAHVRIQLGERGEEASTSPIDKQLDDQLIAFAYGQLAGPDDAIDAPPPDVASYLEDHQAALDGLARTVIGFGPLIDWQSDLGEDQQRYPNRVGHLQLARALAADALVKARGGDASAWDDVHAIVLLARPLLRHEDPNSVAAGLSLDRLANGVARKLPPPVPAWWREVNELDARRAVIAAEQAEAWFIWQWLSRIRGRHRIEAFLLSPLFDASVSGYLNGKRRAAEEFAASHDCAFDVKASDRRWQFPAWSILKRNRYLTIGSGTAFQRAAVFDFERSATERVMAIKEHRPTPATSRCTDGTWSYADGVLRFSIPIPIDPPGKQAVPGTLRYRQ
jgi:hypothetical protein